MSTMIHIHAPQPTDRKLWRSFCPHCKKRRWFANWFTPWYGWDSTCIACGDSWQDGEMCERPFLRGWRQQSIDAAKARWRKATNQGTTCKHIVNP